MMVLRNGQQVEFSLNAEGDLVQTSTFLTQGGWEAPLQNFLLPLGEDDRIIVEDSNSGLARQMVRRYEAIREEEAAAAKRAEEDAAWEAEGRKVAQEVVAGQVAAMDDHILEAFRTGLHRDRRDLVNLYTGADRKTKIADLDLVIGAVEEEQAKRAGLASSADILASFAAL
jgi:hypothetical protein